MSRQGLKPLVSIHGFGSGENSRIRVKGLLSWGDVGSPLVIDIDSAICEVTRRLKQGELQGSATTRYFATRVDTGEVLYAPDAQECRQHPTRA